MGGSEVGTARKPRPPFSEIKNPVYVPGSRPTYSITRCGSETIISEYQHWVRRARYTLDSWYSRSGGLSDIFHSSNQHVMAALTPPVPSELPAGVHARKTFAEACCDADGHGSKGSSVRGCTVIWKQQNFTGQEYARGRSNSAGSSAELS